MWNRQLFLSPEPSNGTESRLYDKAGDVLKSTEALEVNRVQISIIEDKCYRGFTSFYTFHQGINTFLVPSKELAQGRQKRSQINTLKVTNEISSPRGIVKVF